MQKVLPNPRRTGRPSRISREMVVDAALSLIAEAGVDMCTMSGLAKTLNVSVMALYTYFPSRGSLLEAAADDVFSKLSFPKIHEDWRLSLGQWTIALDQHFVSYPAARELLVKEGVVSAGWARTLTPVFRVLYTTGVRGSEYTFAASWFIRSALDAIIQHHRGFSSASTKAQLRNGVESEADKHLIEELSDNLNDTDRDRLFHFSIDMIILGLEKIITGSFNSFDRS
jgi:AcrR family transcriptional regulator